MAETTITGRQALLRVAEETEELRATFITAIDATKKILTTTLKDTTTDLYKYGLARIAGKGIRKVTAYDGTTKKVTVDAVFDSDPVAGDALELCWWVAKKRAKAWNAVNAAIYSSFDAWYQDTLVYRDTAAITLAAGTNEYSLPTDVEAVFRVGFHSTLGEPPNWIPPDDLWRVRGQPGAFKIQFFRSGDIYLPDSYAGYPLCLWYAKREPQLTVDTGTTQLPEAYFTFAAQLYRARGLNLVSGSDLSTASINLPNLMARAREQIVRLGMLKHMPPTREFGAI